MCVCVGGVLTLLFSPVQWTIAWLWVASPLSTNELLSRVIGFSRDSALLKRGELSPPAASSSPSVGEPGEEPPSALPVPNRGSSPPRRVITPLSPRTGPGPVIQAEAINRKTQRCAAAESGSSGRRHAMFCAAVAPSITETDGETADARVREVYTVSRGRDRGGWNQSGGRQWDQRGRVSLPSGMHTTAQWRHLLSSNYSSLRQSNVMRGPTRGIYFLNMTSDQVIAHVPRADCPLVPPPLCRVARSV